MKIHCNHDFLTISDWSAEEYAQLKSWHLLKLDRKAARFYGYAGLDLLDRLSELQPLPPEAETRRQSLRAVRDAMDRERLNPNPVPLYSYPVKLPLYAHQIRGANMALLAFGWR